jgi:4-amino-4-deoxy-L-arabinose transferase-like glycosyltransferase
MTTAGQNRLVLAGIVLIAVTLRLPFLSVPLERDEGAYAYMATRWLAGEVPYRDIFDHKPPLIYLAYFPAAILANGSAEPIRLIGAAWFLATLVMVYVTARFVWGPAAALISTLLYAAFGNAVRIQAINSNTEHLLVLLAMGALCCFLRERCRGTFGWLFVSGLLCGLSVLTKPVAALQFGVLVLAAILGPSNPTAGTTAAVRRATVLLLGFALPIATCCYYFWSQGALDALRQAVLDYNGLYVQYANVALMGQVGLFGYVSLLGYLPPVLACLWLLLYVALWRVLMRERTWSHLVLVAWTAAAFIGIKTAAREYPHYYVTILPALALWGGFAVKATWHQMQWRLEVSRVKRFAAGGVLGLAAILAVAYVADAATFYSSGHDNVLQAEYVQNDAKLFSKAPAVAAVIREASTSDEPILVWGSEPELYYYAQRRSVTRFIYTYPMQFVPSALPEFLNQAQTGHPAVVVAYSGDRDERLARFLAAGAYRELTQMDPFVVYTSHH